MGEMSMKVEGAKELAKFLRRLPVDVQKKHLPRALRRSAERVRARVALDTPVDTEQLQDALADAKISGRVAGNSIRYGVVMPTREELGIAADAPGYYPLAIEYGFLNKRTGKQVPPRRFIRNAVDAIAKQEFRLIRRDVGQQIDRAARRAARKAGVRL